MNLIHRLKNRFSKKTIVKTFLQEFGSLKENDLIYIYIYIYKEKKSEISANFSAIFRLSAGVEKKIHGKNRLKKFRRKIADFSEKIGKNPTFRRFFGGWRSRAEERVWR